MQRIAEAPSDDWWLFTLEGILAIFFGVAAWIWPGLTIGTLVILFGAFAVTSGVVSLFAAFKARRLGGSPWGYIFRRRSTSAPALPCSSGRTFRRSPCSM
jgi:uncharacterized membrane protein HdeD (DUF308 family)